MDRPLLKPSDTMRPAAMLVTLTKTPVNALVQEIINHYRNYIEPQAVPSHATSLDSSSCAYLACLPSHSHITAIASVLHMARRINFTFIHSVTPFFVDETQILADQLAQHALLPEPQLPPKVQPIFWLMMSQLLRHGGINSPGVAMTVDYVNVRSQQMSFHAASVEFCPGCGIVDNRISSDLRLYRVGMIRNPNPDLELHHRQPDDPVDSDLQRYFDFWTAVRYPAFPKTHDCEHCKADSDLSSIRIVTGHLPVYLSLGPSFSPAKVDQDAIIKLTVRQDAINAPAGYEVCYRFESAISYDLHTDNFILYWASDDDRGERQLFQYDHMQHPGEYRQVQDLPSPLRFTTLLLERVSA